MLLRLLPLVAGLLPIAAIHGSYLLAILAGRVPACLPYLEGCTSISATGRYPPASYLFKAAMLPQAVLLVAFWLLSVSWLRQLEQHAGRAGRSGAALGALGVAAAACLVLYVTFLGTSEPFYEFMRRFGVYLYFLCTVLAQLGLAAKVRHLSAAIGDAGLGRLASWQLLLATVPFLLGVLNVALKATLEHPDRAENVIEWVFALLTQLYLVLAWAAWGRTRFAARTGVYSG